ncbi:MAG TPA: hypothetical protein VFV50_13095 [Bdellovibrionales bacterium]|nr:hypothetical protein [Bdellovibrionales bacterium]
MPIFLTAILLLLGSPQVARAADTDVDEIEEFEETETPEENQALNAAEQMVLSGAATIDDADAEAKKAKADAEAAEKQLADAQKRLNEMKLYKASLAVKTKQDVAEAEKRRLEAEKEKAAMDAQRKKVEAEIAAIQKHQQQLLAIERAAKLKAERAKAKLAAAKEKRSQKRKATTKTVPATINKKKTLEAPGRKPTAQQARI